MTVVEFNPSRPVTETAPAEPLSVASLIDAFAEIADKVGQITSSTEKMSADVMTKLNGEVRPWLANVITIASLMRGAVNSGKLRSGSRREIERDVRQLVGQLEAAADQCAHLADFVVLQNELLLGAHRRQSEIGTALAALLKDLRPHCSED